MDGLQELTLWDLIFPFVALALIVGFYLALIIGGSMAGARAAREPGWASPVVLMWGICLLGDAALICAALIPLLDPNDGPAFDSFGFRQIVLAISSFLPAAFAIAAFLLARSSHLASGR